MKVSDLQDGKYILVQDSQDVVGVLDSIGYHGDENIGCLIVEVLDAEYAEYGEVWAIESYVPKLNAIARLLNP